MEALVNEKELLEGLKQDDLACYEQLIDRYSSYVVAVVSKVADGQLGHGDIEELCADVFIKLWDKRKSLTIGEGKLKAYIAALARNKTINLLKVKGKGISIPLEEDFIDYTSPESEVLRQEESQLVNEVIATLPEPDREIFIRRYFYMEKVVDISRRLGINVATVGTKLFRSKKKLEATLRERGVSYE